jgi:hypothetical protein
MKYRINLIKLGYSLLPHVLRQESIKAMIQVLFGRLNGILSLFYAYRNKILKQLEYNGQVFSLENMLKYYARLSNVFIEDGGIVSGLYFYNTEEQKPVMFGTVFFTDSSTWSMGEFIVHCPTGEDLKLPQISYLLDKYKFAGTKYKILFDL